MGDKSGLVMTVARALWERLGHEREESFDDISTDQQEYYRAGAEAAIAALTTQQPQEAVLHMHDNDPHNTVSHEYWMAVSDRIKEWFNTPLYAAPPAQPENERLRSELAAAQEKIKALEGDAARYRWLRDKVDPDAYYEMGVLFDMDKPDEIDAAIDAARNTERTQP